MLSHSKEAQEEKESDRVLEVKASQTKHEQKGSTVKLHREFQWGGGGGGEEEGREKPIAMETSPSEGDIRIIDVISMEEPAESIGTFTS